MKEANAATRQLPNIFPRLPQRRLRSCLKTWSQLGSRLARPGMERHNRIDREYGSLFAFDSMDLEKTPVVKHHISLTNYKPFKERYWWILPHQYEDVKKHLQEMMEIGPWVGTVVLVHMKDSSLRFCIDLRKSNSIMAKDAYGLPHITETLMVPKYLCPLTWSLDIGRLS